MTEVTRCVRCTEKLRYYTDQDLCGSCNTRENRERHQALEAHRVSHPKKAQRVTKMLTIKELRHLREKRRAAESRFYGDDMGTLGVDAASIMSTMNGDPLYCVPRKNHGRDGMRLRYFSA